MQCNILDLGFCALLKFKNLRQRLTQKCVCFRYTQITLKRRNVDKGKMGNISLGHLIIL